MLYKLRRHFNIDGRFYWWCDSFLQNRYARTEVNNIYSELMEFKMGVPQGCSISPIFFICYINSITSVICNDTEICLFADDILLYTNIHSDDTHCIETHHTKLQTSLTNVNNELRLWKATVEPSKTSAIIIRGKRKYKYTRTKLHIDGVFINYVHHIKWLGLTIDCNLTFVNHINNVYERSLRTLGYLYHLCCYKGLRPKFSAYTQLYTAALRPRLEYAAPFWNGVSTQAKAKLNSVQRKAIQYGLNVMRTSGYDSLCMITQLPPLQLRREQALITLYHQCIRLEQQQPSHNMIVAWKTWKTLFSNASAPSFNGLLSPLTRAYLLVMRLHIPDPIPYVQTFTPRNPFQHRSKLTATYSPFDRYCEPNLSEIQASLDGSEVVCWTDGSVWPNPGWGGIGVYVQDRTLAAPLRISRPLPNWVSSVSAELQAIDHAVTIIGERYKQVNVRIIVLSDCKFAVYATKGLWKAHKHIEKIQMLRAKIKALHVIPEIYWIRGHAGVFGNETAHILANAGRIQAQQMSDHDSTRKLQSKWNEHYGLNQYFMSKWNTQWTITSEAFMKIASHTKSILWTLADAQQLRRRTLEQLSITQCTLIIKLITGKVALRQYLFSILVVDSPYCQYCLTHSNIFVEESIEHFLFECKQFNHHRNAMLMSMFQSQAHMQKNSLSLRNIILASPMHCKILTKYIIQTQKRL